jgi:flagellar protein FlaG
MALEALSGAVYHEVARPAQRTENKLNVTMMQDSQAMSINITETPAVAKLTGSNQSDSEQEKEQETKKERQIKDAISKANNKMKFHRTRCEFSYHEETKRVSIKVFDKDTEEVIREIPPEEALEMVEKMWELAGLLIDERR